MTARCRLNTVYGPDFD